ncbi:uncharacterized protein C8A04DRAFT_14325 [Dichotomopilus funicola]|uniref:Enoyl reductase (ER) domain-containing protein n=1 Tax=Dichotomopilus funicola TaxID=1934379 RepID=A0AAN6ZKP0_9PEZI|nr:hypothetical protein C8A04DRAFT_14325 [Dichotomopilus funicola]
MSPPFNTQGDHPSHPKKTMRAVIWSGHPHNMTVRTVPRPTLRHPQDAIIRISTAAICGTDLHTYHGIFGSTTPPWTMGHEGVGVIVETGPGLTHFHVGDRVLVPCGANCGFFSVDKRAEDLGHLYGAGPDFGFGFGSDGGAQAEYLLVPFADDSLVAIPPSQDIFASDLDYISLTDIFPTAWAGLDYSHFHPGDTVAIFGLGPVGLLCAYIALLRGASRVYGIDHVPARLAKAASIGAVPIDFSVASGAEGPASDQILRREPLGVERSVDCIGQECVNHELRPEQDYVLREAVKVTKFNGGIGILGVYIAQGTSEGTPRGGEMKGELKVGVPEMFRKNLTVGMGPVNTSLYEIVPRAVELVRTGRVKLGWIVTAQIGIEEAPEAYRRFDRKEEIKVVIRFPWAMGKPSSLAETAEAGTTSGEGESSKAEKTSGKAVEERRIPREGSQGEDLADLGIFQH